jgi:hypothetical protein
MSIKKKNNLLIFLFHKTQPTQEIIISKEQLFSATITVKNHFGYGV